MIMEEQYFMERIRSLLVGIPSWDYIVFWKLTEDHRCLELMDCICSGTRSNEKINGSEKLVSSGVSCRDVLFTHPRMKSCDLIDNIDTSLTLEYSSVYAETLLSNEARWLNFSYNSDSNPSQETLGTKVLVPLLPFGLLELFVTHQVPEDQEILEFIITQCNVFMEQQVMSFSSQKESLRISQLQISPETSRIMNNEKITSLVEENNKSDDSDDQEDQNEISKNRKKSGKGHQAKNLEAERKRRKKLNDRLYRLRALVPNISKLDRSAILVDAIDYVKELQKQVRDLQLELEEHSDNAIITPAKRGLKLEHGNVLKQESKIKLAVEKVQQMEAQVEVFKLDGNELFLKIFCEHKHGGFVKLMEAFNYLGLEVNNANVTRHTCLVSNIFKVEVKDSKNVQAEYVKESLLELTRHRQWPK